MGSSPKQPPPPDYAGLARQQEEIDRRAMDRQTQINRPNQYGPLGSIEWERDPQTGNWTQRETWSPEVMRQYQQSLNLNEQQMQVLQGLMGRPDFQSNTQVPDFNPYQMQSGHFQGTPWTMGDFEGRPIDAEFQGTPWEMDKFNSDVVNNLPQYDQAAGDEYARMFTDSLLARVTPQQERDQQTMQNQLRMQGLQPGTEAYNRAYQNMLTAHGDVRSQAQLQGMLAGAQEARNVYGTEMQGALAKAAEERNLYNTQLQAQMARGEHNRADFNALLAQQMAQADSQRADYGMGLQGQAARGEHNRADYGMGLAGDSAHAANNAQNQQLGLATQAQQFSQQLQEYMNPYQTSSYTMQQPGNFMGPSFQSFNQAGHSPGADQLGAAQQSYAQQMQRYNEAVAARTGRGSAIGSVVGGIAGAFVGSPQAGAAIGGAAGGALFSDNNLKSDLEPVTDEECYEAMQKLVPHKWKWTGTSVEDMGVSAQQVENYLPTLVKRGERGLLTVNYSKLFAIMLGAFRHMASKERQNGQPV